MSQSVSENFHKFSTSKLSIKEQAITWFYLTRGEYPFNFKLWFLTTKSAQIFNERAARRSRSTSRFGCLVLSRLVCLSPCPLLHEQLRNNFKVELRWLPLSESTQFFCVTPCVSPLHGGQCATCMWARARAVLWRHMPKLAQSNWRNSGATSKWNYDGFRVSHWVWNFPQNCL